jgi:hypothetical protein
MKSHHWMLLLVAVIVFFGSLIIFDAFFDGTIVNPVIHIDNPLSLQTDKSVYPPGSTVLVRISFCKYRNVPSTVDTSIIDSYVKSYPEEIKSIATTGCFTNVLVPWEVVPADTIPGADYYLVRRLTYHVNGFHDVVILLKTNKFTVLP